MSATSSVVFWSSVASTTWGMVLGAYPLFPLVIGLGIGLLAIIMIVKAFSQLAKWIYKRAK